MSYTDDNLDEAFSGESQARNKYELFAKKAEQEGKPQIAKLFKAAAEAERIHARNHADAKGMVGDTISNLKKAIEGENYEHTEMYPEFIEDAKEESRKDALRTFNFANDVEKVHEKLYKKALNVVKNGKDLEEDDIYVCQGCGYTTETEAPEKCPVCGASKKMFEKIR